MPDSATISAYDIKDQIKTLWPNAQYSSMRFGDSLYTAFSREIWREGLKASQTWKRLTYGGAIDCNDFCIEFMSEIVRFCNDFQQQRIWATSMVFGTMSATDGRHAFMLLHTPNDEVPLIYEPQINPESDRAFYEPSDVVDDNTILTYTN